MAEYDVGDHTVAVALHRLRAEGLIYVAERAGWFVHRDRNIVRSTRNRLSRAERAEGRGTFSSDCHAAGLIPTVSTEVSTDTASDEVAGELGIEPGEDVLIRDRVMRGDDEVLQLATSYLPRRLTSGTQVEETDTGPGGIYARLEELGHQLTNYTETVAIGRASEHEARQMELTPGDPVYRIVRTAWSDEQPVEVNHITITGSRYQLSYELPAD